MELIHDRKGRRIRLGDWGGGTAYVTREGEVHVEEVQGKVIGFDQDDGGWWVLLNDGRSDDSYRVHVGEVRCVAPFAKLRPRPQVRQGWFRRWVS